MDWGHTWKLVHALNENRIPPDDAEAKELKRRVEARSAWSLVHLFLGLTIVPSITTRLLKRLGDPTKERRLFVLIGVTYFVFLGPKPGQRDRELLQVLRPRYPQIIKEDLSMAEKVLKLPLTQTAPHQSASPYQAPPYQPASSYQAPSYQPASPYQAAQYQSAPAATFQPSPYSPAPLQTPATAPYESPASFHSAYYRPRNEYQPSSFQSADYLPGNGYERDANSMGQSSAGEFPPRDSQAENPIRSEVSPYLSPLPPNQPYFYGSLSSQNSRRQ